VSAGAAWQGQKQKQQYWTAAAASRTAQQSSHATVAATLAHTAATRISDQRNEHDTEATNTSGTVNSSWSMYKMAWAQRTAAQHSPQHAQDVSIECGIDVRMQPHQQAAVNSTERRATRITQVTRAPHCKSYAQRGSAVASSLVEMVVSVAGSTKHAKQMGTCLQVVHRVTDFSQNRDRVTPTPANVAWLVVHYGMQSWSFISRVHESMYALAQRDACTAGAVQADQEQRAHIDQSIKTSSISSCITTCAVAEFQRSGTDSIGSVHSSIPVNSSVSSSSGISMSWSLPVVRLHIAQSMTAAAAGTSSDKFFARQHGKQSCITTA
jgi:hypothetical protein